MNGKVVIGCDLDTRSFDAQIDYVERQMQEIEHKLEQADLGFEVGDTQKLEADYERLGNKLDSLRKKQAKLNQEQAQMGKLDLSGVKAGINNVNDGLKETVKKVAKWSLALFGIRTAYNAIRGAMSTLSQYDTQMADNIEYIRYALASTLQPVIQTILNLVVKLLQYINYVAKAWTGKNLFKTANAFKSAQKSASGVAKSAKEINKQLAGFDEMNVLSDTSSSGAGGTGGADITAPNIDLTGFQGEVPQWLKWIADNKDIILAVMSGVAAGLLAWKLGLSGIKSLGIGLAIAGIIYTIESIIKYLKDPTFKNFIKILEGISIAIIGVAIAFGSWPVAIATAAALMVLIIVKNFDKIKDLINKAIEWLDKNFLGALRYLFGPLGDILYMPIKYFVEIAKGAFEGFYGGVKKVIEGVMKIFNGDFLGGIKTIFGGLLSIMTTPLRGFVSGVKGLWEQVKKSIQYWKEKFRTNFNDIKDYFMNPINNFINGIKGLWNKIKNSVEEVGKKIGEKLNPSNIVKKVGKGVSNVGKGIKNFFGFAKGGIVVPKLASGGIINQPGRGVPLASAIGGEKGQEGVIPLTDSQQMELLGAAIGRYITINAHIINTMNGRVISRELQKVNNTNDFAFNK